MQTTLIHRISVDNKIQEFHRLVLPQLDGIVDLLSSLRDARVRKLAAIEKLNNFETINALLEVGSNQITYWDVQQYGRTPRGAWNIVRLSLTSHGMGEAGAEALLSQMHNQDILEVAGCLVLDRPSATLTPPKDTGAGGESSGKGKKKAEDKGHDPLSAGDSPLASPPSPGPVSSPPPSSPKADVSKLGFYPKG